jgi:hypothetical protein
MDNQIILMDKAEARKLVTAIREGWNNVRLMLLELDEREGWKALGYKSLAECGEKEFGFKKSQIYNLITAGKVERLLEVEGTFSTTVENTRVQRSDPAIMENLPTTVLVAASTAPAGRQSEVMRRAAEASPTGRPTQATVKTAVQSITLETIPTKYHKILAPLNDEQTAAVWQWAIKLWPDGRIPGERLAQRVAQVAVKVEAVAPPPPAVHVAGTPRTSVAPVPPVAGPTAAMPALCPTHARPYGVMLHGGDGRYILQCPACPADTAIVVCEC